MNHQTNNLSDMLTLIDEQSASKKTVSVGDVLEIIGRRSFGPVLVLVGVVLSTPIVGDIPGVPTIFGSLVILIGLQLLVGRDYIWIPNVILKQKVSTDSLKKTIKWTKVPAQYIDAIVKPRLKLFTGRPISYVMLLVAIVLSFATPAMEFVPFSANVAGAIFLLFGLSLITRDGLLALLGLMTTTFLGGLLFYFLT